MGSSDATTHPPIASEIARSFKEKCEHCGDVKGRRTTRVLLDCGTRRENGT
jgi:hypothetical protein